MKIITYQNKRVANILKRYHEHKITEVENMKTYHVYDNPLYMRNPLKEAYDYMINRTKKLINNEDLDDDIIAPIWGWSASTPYRLLRKLNKNYPNGYQIVLEIPDDKVLLTDYSAYEDMISGGLWSVCNNEEEYHALKEKGQDAIYEAYDKAILNPQDVDYIQATFWKIKEEYIVSIRKVRRRHNRKKKE